MQGNAQSNNAAIQELLDSDTVSTLKPWYIPAEYPRYVFSQTWKDSYLEFVSNKKFRLVKQNTNDRDSLFVTGDYLFDYSNNLLYLKFTDDVSLESYEMVFHVEYYKLKKIKRKRPKTGSGAIHPNLYPKEHWTFYAYVIIPKLPIRARKNLRHWNGMLEMYRYVGATWDMPIAEILKCETVNSGYTVVQSGR